MSTTEKPFEIDVPLDSPSAKRADRSPGFLRRNRLRIGGGVFAIGFGTVGILFGLDFLEKQNQSEVSKKLEGILGERAANGAGVTVDVYGDHSEKVSIGCEGVPDLDPKIAEPDRQITFTLKDGTGEATLLLPEREPQLDYSKDGVEIIPAGQVEIDVSTKDSFAAFLASPELAAWCQHAYGVRADESAPAQ